MKETLHNPYHTSFPLMEKLISTQYPQVFSHYYPRIYESVGQYNSPKYLAYGLAHAHVTLVSPRMHWRRGHFRNQPYGPALQLVKRIWLEPSIIACKEESA